MGPAIKPFALAKVLEIKRKVNIPIIGMGGIMNWKDVAGVYDCWCICGAVRYRELLNPAAADEMIKELKHIV